MTSLTINDADLSRLRDSVVVLTGGSSGIGLATTNLLLDLGAKVVVGDISPAPEPVSSPNLTYVPVDVTDWQQLSALFKKAVETHGRIDHVFANAGIAPTECLLEDDVDENGELLPPSFKTVNVNLLAVMSTVKLALYHMRKQPEGGSIVLIGSASSIQRFPPVDYTTSKHGVLGLMRGLYPLLHPHLPIRINTLAPAWTVTGMVSASLASAGAVVQPPSVVARSAALLMADESRHGQLIYSNDGEYLEVETPILDLVREIVSRRGDAQGIAQVGMRMARETLKKFGVMVEE